MPPAIMVSSPANARLSCTGMSGCGSVTLYPPHGVTVGNDIMRDSRGMFRASGSFARRAAFTTFSIRVSRGAAAILCKSNRKYVEHPPE